MDNENCQLTMGIRSSCQITSFTFDDGLLDELNRRVLQNLIKNSLKQFKTPSSNEK